VPKSKIRVVIDTNVWISFLIGKTLAGLAEAIINERVTMLFSEELFDELLEVLHRPKFEKYFSRADIAELISLIHIKFEQVEITKHFTDCRDPKDNFLLDLCVSGKADYLITGDDDLLSLTPFYGVEIISYSVFQKVLQRSIPGKLH